MQTKDIYEYVVEQETFYKTVPIPIDDNWEFNMRDHIRRCFLYLHSKFFKGDNNYSRPNKNIVRPIRNFQIRTEGFDVKDIQPYVDEDDSDHKSFIVKKFHPEWARKNGIDKFIDQLVESYVDYGLVIVKNVPGVCPKVVNLRSLAFVDQANVLAAPICEKHYMSHEEVLSQSWYSDKIEEYLVKSASSKKGFSDEKEYKSPGKFLEVYELHGILPAEYYDSSLKGQKPFQQMHIIGMYRDEKNNKAGVTLFKSKEKNPYKALKRDDVFGRACGFSAVEELFDHQIWTNYGELRIKNMLDAAVGSMIITDDEAFASRNNLAGRTVEPNEVLTRASNSSVTRLDMQQPNVSLFNDAVARWEEKAQRMGSASDSALSDNPSSGTPFALEQLVAREGRGIHEFRQGQISEFVVEIYIDWILPHLVAYINKGDKITTDLTADELEYVIDKIVTNKTNEKIKKAMIEEGRLIPEDEKQAFQDIMRSTIAKRGKRFMIEAIKDEVKGIPTTVKINIKNKQKNLPEVTGKLVNVFRQIIATPDVMKIPGMVKILNQIIEYSGLDPVDFDDFNQPTQIQPQEGKPTSSTKPIKELATNTNNNNE